MSTEKVKKSERPNKPRDAVYVSLNDELRAHLEEERERRGGKKAGVRLPQIIREKLTRQLECEKSKKQ